MVWRKRCRYEQPCHLKKYLKYLVDSDNYAKIMESHKEGLQETRLKIYPHKVGRKTGS